ncbi:MAG TPA: hypothetical protein VF025_07205 [Gaiellaceae bacterium]
MATIEKPTNGRATVPFAAAGAPREAAYYEEEAPRGAGWVAFSAIVLGLVGTFSFIDGLLAISSSKVFTANATYVFSDLHTWGWIVTILGALAIVASFALFAGSELARWFGIAVASLNAIGQLMFVHANPWWAVCMFAVNILVIYGLAAYAGSRLRSG